MDDRDYETFDRAFRKLGVVFRLRLKEADLKELIATYFRILDGARLDAVLAGAKVCLTRCKTFPKPAEWLDALPKHVAPGAPATELRRMGAEEAEEWARAERLRWEDQPCACVACVAAGVSDRPIRFVPQFTPEDTDDRAIHPAKQRPVTTGHWAHGEELARWYRAKEAFYAKCDALGLRGVATLLESGWKPAASTRSCGQCGASIPVGTSYYARRLPGVRREFVRCANCSGERQPGEEG